MSIKVFLLIAVVFSSVTAEEVMVGPPKTMNPEWERKVLGIRQDVVDVVGAVEELVSSIATSFEEGFFSKLREYVNKEQTGEYLEYWPNGKLKARIGFKNRQAHGHVHGWYEDGKDAFKGYFQEGVKQGMHIVFYPADRPRLSDAARVTNYNEQGNLDHEQYTFHKTGWLWVNIPYKNGQANGLLECWDSNRKQYISAAYKNNSRSFLPTLQKENYYAPYGEYVDEIIHKFEKEISEEYGLIPMMSGADMPKDLERISVGFDKLKKTSIEEARELMVKLKERLVEIVNAHEKIRPYLREFPFTPERTNVSIGFRNPDGTMLKDTLALVSTGKTHEVFYKINDPNNPYLFKQVHEESYEEAVKIVKGKP